MKHLICNYCKHFNPILSERTIFCKNCNKKLENNFIDWKKSKLDNSFDSFLIAQTDNVELELKIEEPIKKTSKLNFDGLKNKQNIALLSFVIISWFIVFNILKNSLGYFNPDQTIPNTEISWNKYQLGNDIKIYLPLVLKKQETQLGSNLAEMIGDVQGYHAETSSQSFSITIEEININNTYMLGYMPLLNVYDEYMTSSGDDFYLHNDLTTTKIKNYRTYIDRGSYLFNGENYLYENYTLHKRNKAFKIIISYVKDDKFSNLCAEVIANSLFSNKEISI